MAAALYSLYLALLYVVAAGGLLLPVGVFAGLVFLLEASKLAAVIGHPRLRNGSWQLVYIFQTIEIILLPAVYGALLALHVQGAGALVFRFVAIYLASQLLLIPPFSIYRTVRSVSKGEGAGGVLSSSVLHFGLIGYALELAVLYRPGMPGIEGLGDLMLPTSAGTAVQGGLSAADALIVSAGLLFYVSLMAYAVTDPEAVGVTARSLALGSVATLATVAWILASTSAGESSVSLLAGTFAMITLVWWFARG